MEVDDPPALSLPHPHTAATPLTDAGVATPQSLPSLAGARTASAAATEPEKESADAGIGMPPKIPSRRLALLAKAVIVSYYANAL